MTTVADLLKRTGEGSPEGLGIDLEASHSICGYRTANRWLADIECMLLETTTGRMAVLTKNCVTENVDQRSPIFAGKRALFRIVATTDGCFCIRSGAGIYHPFDFGLSDLQHYEANDAGAKILVGQNGWQRVEFAELLQLLREDATTLGRLQVSFRWRQGSREYKLLTRVRYVNFPPANSDFLPFDYVQPICGEVLTEAEGRFRLAYVAALVAEKKIIHSEIISEQCVDYFQTKRGFLGDRSFRLLSALTRPFRRFFLTDEYLRRVEIDPAISFYRFARPPSLPAIPMMLG